MPMLQPVTHSTTGHVLRRGRYTIRKPTHIVIDERGEIVAIMQLRARYPAMLYYQLGQDKPRWAASAAYDMLRLDPDAWHYQTGLDSAPWLDAIERGALSIINLRE